MIDKLAASPTLAANSTMLAQMERMRLEASAGQLSPLPAGVSAAVSAPSFASVLDQMINHVDNQQHVATEKQRAVDMGISDDLTGAMLESQKASVAFSAMIQVRNKLQTAFDDVINISL